MQGYDPYGLDDAAGTDQQQYAKDDEGFKTMTDPEPEFWDIDFASAAQAAEGAEISHRFIHHRRTT